MNKAELTNTNVRAWWLDALKRHPVRFFFQIISDRSVLGFFLGFVVGFVFAAHLIINALQETGL